MFLSFTFEWILRYATILYKAQVSVKLFFFIKIDKLTEILSYYNKCEKWSLSDSRLVGVSCTKMLACSCLLKIDSSDRVKIGCNCALRQVVAYRRWIIREITPGRPEKRSLRPCDCSSGGQYSRCECNIIRAIDKMRNFNFHWCYLCNIYLPNPMFGHLLESSRRDDSYTCLNIEFAEEKYVF